MNIFHSNSDAPADFGWLYSNKKWFLTERRQYNMWITDELVTYLEALGRIKLPEESRAKAQNDLQEILQYIDTLSELDTEGIEPMSHALTLTNVMREDIVQPSAPADEVLVNAPAKKDSYFLVPRSFE